MSATKKERTNSINEIRSKLKRHIKKYIGMESAQEKELLIFDKTVSRRDFIGGTLKIGAVATLIGKGMMPSAWASTNPDLALPASEMPIFTDAEKASYRAVDVDFKSDLVNGVLQQKNIENIPSSALEDTLEAVNVLGCTQVSFDAYQVAQDNANDSRNFGHPEIVRLEDDVPGHKNQGNSKKHKVTIYEHQASGNAALTEKTIHLHSFADSVFSVPKEEGFTLHKGNFISNGLFVMELSKDGAFKVYQRDLAKLRALDSKPMTDELTVYSLIQSENHTKPIDVVCFQADGNFVGYSDGGKTVEFSKGTNGDFLMDNQSIKIGNTSIYSKSSNILSDIPDGVSIKPSDQTKFYKGTSILSTDILNLTLHDSGCLALILTKDPNQTWLWSNKEDLEKLGVDPKRSDHVIFTSDGNLQVRDAGNNTIWSLSLIAASCDEFMHPLNNAILEIEKSGNVSVSVPGGSDNAPRVKYWQTNTHFIEVNAEDTNYNRVVSINGGLHNQVSNGKVRNQKMILVARQPTYHDNDGNPLSQGWDDPNQWVSQSSYITDWTKQMVLLTQNSELDLHIAEHKNQDQLGESFDGGTIADTSGEVWQKWYPLAKLYNEFHKVVFNPDHIGIGYGIGINTDPYKNNQYKVLIEDIGTFKSKDGLFSCIYGTVSANLFCNIGFIITLPDDTAGKPIVQFYSINQDMRRDLISTIINWANFGNLFSVNIPSGVPVQGPLNNPTYDAMWSKEYFKQLHRPVAYSNGKLDILYSGIYFDKNGTKPMLSAYKLSLPSNNDDAVITGYYSDKSGANDHYWDPNNIVQYSYGEYNCFPKIADIADKDKRAYQYLIDAVSNKAHYRFNEHNQALAQNTTLDSIFWPNEDQGALNFMSLIVEYYGTNPNEPVLYMNYATFKVKYINVNSDDASISALFNEKLTISDGNYCDNNNNCFRYDDIDKYGYPQQAILSFAQDYKFQALIKDHLGNLYSFEQLYDRPLSQWDKTDDGSWVLSPTDAWLINRDDHKQFPALPSSGLITRYYQNVERLLKWTAFTKKVEFLVVSNDPYHQDSATQRLDGTPYAKVTTYNNQRVSQHYHYCRQDKVGNTWSDDKINANVATHETELQQNPVKAQVYDVELSLINADGTLVPDESASIEIRFDDHTYFEFLNAGPNKGMGAFAGPKESIFLKPDNSGRVYFQVKAPDVAQMSGINLSYRIHHPDDYSYSNGEFPRDGSLLAYRDNLEDTNAFSVFNLAYNVHDRYHKGSVKKSSSSFKDSKVDIDVSGKIYDYVANNMNGDVSTAGKTDTVMENLTKSAKSLHDSNLNAKKVSMQSPKFMSAERNNDFFTVKLDNKQYQLTHLDPGAPHRRYVMCIQSGQNNIFTDIWHKLCDAALAVINRIKQAINAIVNMINDVLGAIADLGIPGISDLAKIAKGVVSFLGAVINAALDYMAAFINMLKYLFDFKRAQNIGIQMVDLLHSVMGATKFNSFNINPAKLDGIDSSKLKLTSESTSQANTLESSKSNANTKAGSTNSRPENMNHVHNTFSKHDSSSSGSSDSISSKQKNVLRLRSDTGILAIVDQLSSLGSPASLVEFPKLCGELTKIDLSSALSGFFSDLQNEMSGAINDAISLNFADAITQGLTELKVNKFLATVLEFILGVKLDNYLDILELIIGYPLMLLSELLIGTVKGICEDQGQKWPSNFDKIEGMLTDVNTLLSGKKSLYAGNEATWKKDTMVYFNAIYGAFGNVCVLLDRAFLPQSTEARKELAKGKGTLTTFMAALAVVDRISTGIDLVTGIMSQEAMFAGFANADLVNNNAYYQQFNNGFDSKPSSISVVTGPLGNIMSCFTFLIKNISLIMSLFGDDGEPYVDSLDKFLNYLGLINSVTSLIDGILAMAENGDLMAHGPQSKQYINDCAGGLLGNIDNMVSAIMGILKIEAEQRGDENEPEIAELVIASSVLKVGVVCSEVLALALPENS